MSPTMLDSSLKVRGIKRQDSTASDWLARLARGSALTGPAFLAERDGVPVAAVALTSGAVVADPRNSSEDIVQALKFLRYQAMRQGGESSAVRSLLRRRASSQATFAAGKALTAARA